MLIEKLNDLYQVLAENSAQHAHGTPFYRFMDAVTKHAFREAKSIFDEGRPLQMASIGEVILPYHCMGAVDSIDLFNLDELILFSFYDRARAYYKRAIDIGANIGLHSVVLAKCGVLVDAWEPDPRHFAILEGNLRRNGVEDRVKTHQKAVSNTVGQREFVRVLGNTTSSHLAGAKANPYGELERFTVEIEDFKEIAADADLVKIDAEGHEGVIITALPIGKWAALDALVEIGTPATAEVVFAYFQDAPINVFVQKKGWGKAACLADMPVSYKEGSIFISAKPRMPW